MKINFIKELKNCIGEAIGFSVSVYSNGAQITNVKTVIDYSKGQITVKTCDKKVICIFGVDLKITKLLDGDLTFKGKINLVKVE